MNKISIRGPKLFSYQRDVADLLLERGAGKTVCCKSRRQTGKTTLISSLLCYYSFNFSGSKNFVVSPSLAQAKNVFNQVFDAVSSGDKSLIQKANANDLELKFINNSTVSFKSEAMGNRLRGYHSDGIICLDECAFMSDDILPLILPWGTFHRANILMVSSPFIRNGFFYKYFTDGLDGVEGISSVDWTDHKYQEELDAILPPETLEMYRRQMPANQFKSEMLGEWLDDEGMVFTGFRELAGNYTIKPSDKLYWGIDWGLGETTGDNSDDTVLTAINQNGEQVYLEFINNMSPTRQQDRIGSVLKHYEKQTYGVQPELNSLGTVYTDNLKAKVSNSLASKIKGFNTSNESKGGIVASLQESFETGKVHILNNEKQMRQLAGYAAEFNPKTRRVTYNGAAGTHDDACIALMLAHDCWKTNNRGTIHITLV